MSLTFKFDKLVFNVPANESKQNDIEVHSQPGNTPRYLRLVNIDGSWTTLYYIDLRGMKFSPEENSITLQYTSEAVILKGRNLEKIVDDLESHRVKIIQCTDKRYEAARNEDECIVFEILVEGK